MLRIDNRETALTILVSQLQSCPAGKLAAGWGRSPDGFANDLEGQLEDVMQDKNDSLSRAQLLEHNQQREPYLVIEGDPVQGIAGCPTAASIASQLVEDGRVTRRLQAVRGGSHLVEADPAGDDDEPSPFVFDSVIIGGNKAREGFLHGILGCS